MAARPVGPRDGRSHTVTGSAWAIPLLLTLFAACDRHKVTLLGPESPEETVATYRIPLEGHNVRPVIEPTAATGEAVLSFKRQYVGMFGGNAYAYRFEFVVTAEHITGVTAAHLHGPATQDTTGPLLATLFHDSSGTGAVDGELITGSIPREATRFSDAADERLAPDIYAEDILDLLRDGLVYVDIHTLSRPAGEVRGQ